MIEAENHRDPWWKRSGGLRFSCTGCGKCCSGEPGAVWITEEELTAMADHLGVDPGAFERRYCRIVDGKLALREVRRPSEQHWTRINHDCVFLEGGRRCAVYEQRPMQCRTFPFWPDHLKSPQSWTDLTKRGCEGVSVDAELVEVERIESELAATLRCPGFEES